MSAVVGPVGSKLTRLSVVDDIAREDLSTECSMYTSISDAKDTKGQCTYRVT